MDISLLTWSFEPTVSGWFSQVWTHRSAHLSQVGGRLRLGILGDLSFAFIKVYHLHDDVYKSQTYLEKLLIGWRRVP